MLLLVNTKVFASTDSLNITIFFETDSISIESEEYEKLKSNIKEISPNLILSIRVTAYCDDTGDEKYNDSLSIERAKYIEDILRHEFLLKDSNIFEIQGKGSLPINKYLSETLKEQRARNRKAEIIIKTLSEKEDENHTLNTIKNNEDVISIKDLDVGEKIELRNILYEAGRSKFLPQSYVDLNLLLKNLNDNKNHHIKILGHINYSINNRYNYPNKDSKDLDTGKPLSEERAKAVFNFLIQNGIDATRLSYEGLGGLYPTEKGGKYNRRVEIEVIKK